MKHTMSHNIRSQQGFTLIELMISLVLGLLISAAIIQVFITSQRVDRVQTAGSEIQDKAVFGLQSIEAQLRLANLGNGGVSINDTTANGGVILTSGDNQNDATNIITKDILKTGYLTRSHDMDSSGNNEKAKWNGTLTNTDKSSDQLTIQYTNITGSKLYDCEGEEIEPNETVIARYFVIEDDVKTKKVRKNLNLNCNAGRIKTDDILYKLEDFGGNQKGQTIIEGIDQFNIRLGVQHSTVISGQVVYKYEDMTVSDYMSLTDTKPPIINIRIAILARSTANSPDASVDDFTIFGKKQTLKEQTNAPKYLRRVYESNILLRNARVTSPVDISSP